MSQPLLLDCASAADIPSPGHLRELVTDEQHVVLRFPTELEVVTKATLVLRLSSVLPEFGVFDSGSPHDFEQITVKKVIASEDVRANEASFVAALRLFRQTASTLVTQLAGCLRVPVDHLLGSGFDHVQTGWVDRLRSLWGRRVRGKRLDREWTYAFHGEACRFENQATGQVVEVRLGFGTEFGVLDPYFFALFVKSTPSLAPLARLLRDNFHDTQRVLELLHRAGHLRVVERGCYRGVAVREEEDQPRDCILPGAPAADATTEDDWNRCTDPMRMLCQLRGRTTDRKVRLFLCAWCRCIWERIPDEQCRRAVETSEHFADKRANDKEREAVFCRIRDAAWNDIRRLLRECRLALRPAWDVAVGAVADPLSRMFERDVTQSAIDDAERERQCYLLRDIFGPCLFREVPIDPSILTWKDGVIRRIAQAAYEQRNLPEGTLDNHRFHVLADALEEAGCTNQDILAHCRREGQHVRGCWAVDLILGRQ